MSVETKKPTPRVWQKGYLPSGIDRTNSDVAFHINKFPLGDADNFSVSRACYAMLMSKRETGAKYNLGRWTKYAPWERKYIDALQEISFKLPDGVVPERGDEPGYLVGQTKAMGDAVSGIDGGFLAPELWSSQYFQILTSISALDRLPVTRFNVPVRGLHIPKTALDVTVSYPGENNAPTATQYKFGQLSYTARKAVILINAGIELMRDAPTFNDQLLREEGARSMAVDRDVQAFQGIGGNNPTGITSANTVGPQLSQVGTFTPAGDSGNGATPAYTDYIGAKYQAEHLSTNTNVTTGQAIVDGVVANMRSIKSIQAILDSSSRPIWPQDLEASGGFIGIRNWKMVTDVVLPINIVKGTSSDLSNIIFGSWVNYVLFDCLTLGFDITEEGQGMANAQAQIRLVHRWDAGPSHPEAFVVMPGRA